MTVRRLGSDDVLYVFGPFTLDPVIGVLRKDGAVIALPNKSLDLLVVLVQHRGQLVTKDELLRAVWPDVVVEENNLARHIANLRKVLNDRPRGHEFIVTVIGRGYRFVALGEEMQRAQLADAIALEHPEPSEEGAHEVPAEPVSPPPVLLAVAKQRAGRTVAIILPTILLLAILGDLFHGTRGILAMRSTPWQLTFESGVQMEPTWSSDGRHLAYAADRSGNSDIWVQSIDGVAPTRLTFSDASDWQPAWSPDGRSVAFRSERDGGGLYIVPATGGTEQRIASFGYHPQWSPDGSKLLFYGDLNSGVVRFGEPPKGNAKPHAVYLLTLSDGRPVPLSADLGNSFISYRVKWHPDGQRVSVWGKHRTAGWSFWTGTPLDWNSIRSEIAPEVADQLQTGDVTLADFTWSQRRNALFFEVHQGGVSNIWRIDVNPNTMRWQRASALTTGTARNVNISVSPDGSKVAFSVRSDHTRLWSFPFDAVSGRIAGEGHAVLAEGADAQFDVSADGREIVYRTSRRGTPQLWKRSLPQGEARLLVSGPALSVPRFSRDGTRIVARRDTRVALESSAVQQDIVLLASSGGQPQLLTTAQRTAPDDLTTFAPFDWSVDGGRILSACSVQERIGVCLLSLPSAPHAEREMRVIASSPDRNLFQAQFSPADERLICFQAVKRATGRPTTSTIHVASAAGGPWVSITDGEFWDDKPRWSPNGRMIYYVSRRNGFFNVWARPFDPVRGRPFGDAFRVTDFESPSHSIFNASIAKLHISVLSDRLILPITDSSANIWMLENADR